MKTARIPRNAGQLTLAALLVLCSTACVSAPRARPEVEAEAKAFRVPAGESRLYVVRPSSFGLAVLYQVAVDGKVIGSLPAETFVATDVPPGDHVVALTNATSEANITVHCGADRPCFVRAGMHPSAMSNRARMIEVGEEEGRQLVQQNAMVESLASP